MNKPKKLFSVDTHMILSLLPRQRMIRRAMHVYLFVMAGVKPHYFPWMDGEVKDE